MYNGYRIRINGNVFPNNKIAKGTFTATPQKRVVELWTDAVLVEHEITVDMKKERITFSVIPHDSDLHGEIIAYFQQNENVIEFFDDRTNEYKIGDFRLEDITWAHENTRDGKIQYAETPITFIEN